MAICMLLLHKFKVEIKFNSLCVIPEFLALEKYPGSRLRIMDSGSGAGMTKHRGVDYIRRLAKSKSGFTLIEVVIYIALFGILFGGAIVASYSVIESSGRNQTRAQLQAEGDFLLGKIAYALSGAQSISMPVVGASGSILSVAKYGGSATSVYATGSALMLQTSATNLPINTSSMGLVASSLVFTHSAASGNGVNPESIKAQFTLTTFTPTGAVLSQDFSSTTYVRK